MSTFRDGAKFPCPFYGVHFNQVPFQCVMLFLDRRDAVPKTPSCCSYLAVIVFFLARNFRRPALVAFGGILFYNDHVV